VKGKLSQRSVGLKYGFRSGLEEKVMEQLDRLGTAYRYEDVVIPFTQPVKPRKYTPDFLLPNGIIVETKGRFETSDRQKHLLVKEQHPELDIRFVFSRSSTRISKQSRTTYADWCKVKGFLHADGLIPLAWIMEAHSIRRWDAAEKFLKGGEQ
jgi:hypothetical protein